MTDQPATRQDIRDAINELKLYIVDREASWIKWIVSFQLTYFVVTIGVAFVTGHVK